MNDSTIRTFNTNLLSLELVGFMNKNDIKVFTVSRNELLRTNGDARFTHAFSDNKLRTVFAIVDDIIGSNLTASELECILWHECAHIYLDTCCESLCDAFAVSKVGKPVYDSTFRKTEIYLNALAKFNGVTRSRSDKYAHRNK